MAESKFTYHDVELPSGGRPYGGALKESDGRIRIRTIKGRDEKLLAELSLDNFEKKFKLLLEGLIEGFDVANLTVGDRLHLSVWLSVNSYPEYARRFPFNFTCEQCGLSSDMEVDLSQMEVIDLPEDYEEPHRIKLQDESSVGVRLFRVQDEMNIATYEKQGGSGGWLYRYAQSIVDDRFANVQEKIQFLDDLDAGDLARIRAFQEEYAHGPVMETRYECEKCGGEGRVPVPFRLEMLFPYGETLKKHFGNAVQSPVPTGDVSE